MKTFIQNIFSNNEKKTVFSNGTQTSFRKNRPNYYEFDKSFLYTKALFLNEFKQLPNEYFISNIDRQKVLEYFNEKCNALIIENYEKIYYSWHREKTMTDNTVLLLKNEIILDIGDDYLEIQFAHASSEYVQELIDHVITLKAESKEEPTEMNIITLNGGSLDLKAIDIKPTELDLNLYYNDDFIEVDKVIKQRLQNENDKGIVLLHGLPGTGKTTYLRHLIGGLKKKILFVSPAVATNLMNPEFIDLLIDNPNSILIIEDAENIIMDRRFSQNSSVSNLLNISDGLLSDCLSVQLICTFNSELSFVDSALLRKGRLIAKYEFGKLSVEKSQALSKHAGFDKEITQEMTVTEIINQHEVSAPVPQIEVIGFRRERMLNN